MHILEATCIPDERELLNAWLDGKGDPPDWVGVLYAASNGARSSDAAGGGTIVFAQGNIVAGRQDPMTLVGETGLNLQSLTKPTTIIGHGTVLKTRSDLNLSGPTFTVSRECNTAYVLTGVREATERRPTGHSFRLNHLGCGASYQRHTVV